MSAGRATATTELGGGEPVVELLYPRLLAVLDRAPLFHALSRRHRRKVARLAEFRRYEDGATVVRLGDRGVAFYDVLDGEARMVPAQGRERRLATGDHFGELSLFDGAPRAATVSAAGALTVARIGRLDFTRLLREEPTLAIGLLPGLVLIVRDLLRADAQRIPDLGQLDPSRADGGEGDTSQEAVAAVLEERTALGWRQLLRQVTLFRELPERHLQRIARLATIERWADGATAILAGSKGDSLQVILEGGALVRTPGGHTRTLEANESFGELALLDGAPRSATVVAVGPLTTAQIRRVDFKRVLRGEPAMAMGLSKSLVRTIRDMQGSCWQNPLSV
jgi:CRP-like cAMP-binding protein